MSTFGLPEQEWARLEAAIDEDSDASQDVFPGLGTRMNSEELLTVKAAALDLLEADRQMRVAGEESESAVRRHNHTREAWNRAREALLKVAGVGRNKPTRAIVPDGSDLVVIVSWRKNDKEAAGYTSVEICNADGEVK